MWFWKREEPINELESDLSIRVAEIQSRIAALRSSLERAEKPNKNIAPSKQLSQIGGIHTTDTRGHNERAAKAAELDDLKAKLLGKKL